VEQVTVFLVFAWFAPLVAFASTSMGVVVVMLYLDLEWMWPCGVRLWPCCMVLARFSSN
jgi:hypothetical protein